MNGVAGALAAVAMLVLAGCSGGGSDAPTPDPTVSDPGVAATSPSAAPSASSGTSTARVPGADCLTGTWRLVRFVGVGGQSTYGTGQGGDVAVTFDDGRYHLVGNGREPITVNLAGAAAHLRIDGTVAGTYRPEGSEMAFTVGKATGQGTLQAGNERRTVPMASVAQVIAPRGTATVTCPEKVLQITLEAVRLELER